MLERIIAIEEPAPAIAVVRMEDRTHKNTFTNQLIEELTNAFAQLADRSEIKVIILTGYDTYFCSGGTQEGLLGLFDGKFKFTDKNLYSLALNCPIPVIAAMQGHAIGGGLVMGMFADLVLLAREAVYTANFMKYGFTPGMGSTFILPRKLGLALAEEMMLSAATYRGEELQRRGVPFPVLPREQIMPRALELASSLAEKPRFSLVTLKDHLVAALRKELPAYIEQEVIMHDQTFNQPEVKGRIEGLFGR